MTTLTATAALKATFQDLIEGLDPAALNISNTSSTKFTITLNGGVQLQLTGTGFQFFGTVPLAGTITGAVVTSSTGATLYTLSSFSVSISSQMVGDLLKIFDGADTVNGSAFGDYIYGFGGNDTLKGNGGGDRMFGQSGNDTMRGGAGNDTMKGGAGADKIFGDGSDDKIYGGTGHDISTGGWGKDTFYFVDPIAKRTTFSGWDEIKDFVPSDDTIALESSVFTQLRSEAGTRLGTLKAEQFSKGSDNVANDPNDRIIYNTTTGELFYDSNGSAANTSTSYYVKIAELDLGLGHPFAVSAADFVLV